MARPKTIMKAVEVAVTCCQKTCVGMPIVESTSAPPTSPASSWKMVSGGIASAAATMRGITRKRTGGRPIVVSAFSSSFAFIVPISAAKALPVRPARMIAVTTGPSSRKSAIASMSET